MKHINPPKTPKLYEYNAFVQQRTISLNSRNIVDSTSIKCDDNIVLTIHEFPDIRYPEFDIEIDGVLVCSCRLPSLDDYHKPTFELTELCGRDLTDDEKSRVLNVFNSHLKVNKRYTVLDNVRFIWDGSNCHGITFNNI